jgi:hypothetical protein
MATPWFSPISSGLQDHFFTAKAVGTVSIQSIFLYAPQFIHGLLVINNYLEIAASGR